MADMPTDFWSGWIIVLTVVSFIGLGWLVYGIYFTSNGGAAAVQQWLLARDDIENLFVDGELVRFSHAGDRAEQVVLLREMVHSGFPIAAFGCRVKSLEDVFMHVTQGFVQ